MVHSHLKYQRNGVSKGLHSCVSTHIYRDVCIKGLVKIKLCSIRFINPRRLAANLYPLRSGYQTSPSKLVRYSSSLPDEQGPQSTPTTYEEYNQTRIVLTPFTLGVPWTKSHHTQPPIPHLCSPLFVLPLPKPGGFFTFLWQVQLPHVFVTSVDEYRR